MKRYLEIVSGPDKGARFELFREETVIGRSPDAQISLNDSKVSGVHCQVLFRNGQVQVEDLNSANGTRVNGQAASKAKLNTGDDLQVGLTILRMVSSEHSSAISEVPAKKEEAPAKKVKKPASGKTGLNWWGCHLTVMVSLVLCALPLIAWPLINDLGHAARKEALGRYSALALAVATGNAEYLLHKQAMFANTSLADNYPGVMSTQVLNKEGVVVAPYGELNRAPKDSVTKTALSSENMLVVQTGSNTYRIAVPVRALNLDTGSFVRVGTVSMQVSTRLMNKVVHEAWVLVALAMAIFVLVAVAASWLLSRLSLRPVAVLREKWEAVIDGEAETVDIKRGPKELMAVAGMINNALAREKLRAWEPGASSGAERRPQDAARQLQTVLDSSVNAMIVLDKDHHVILVNNEAERLLGRGIKGLIGKHVFDLSDNEAVNSECAKVVHEASNRNGMAEGVISTPNGRIKIVASVQLDDQTPSLICLCLVQAMNLTGN